MEKKTKLFVLTGFLGTGKTTLLLDLLDKMQSEKIGIIQNEFGKISIDGDIIRRGDIEMREVSRGSIFCTCLKLNFVSALAEMGDMGLEYLFVESSGLADPSNLAEILAAVEAAKGRQPYQLCGVICLVDGVDFQKDAAELETVQRQIVHCNIALLNKCDLIDRAQIDQARRQIRQLNQNCMIIETTFGQIDPALLLTDWSDYAWAENEDTTNTAETKPKTFSLEYEGEAPKQQLDAFLKEILSDCYRIKGFCLLDGRWNQVDVVGDRIDYKPCPEKEISQLIFISRTGIQLIRRINDQWNAILNRPVKLKN